MSRVETRVARTAIIAATFIWAYSMGSEFPERECCDPVYPIPEPTSRAPSAPTPTGRSGPNIKTAVAILNCLLARQLCFEDPSCSAILEIIPRVCGPELVACSTVTVPKCQAALVTLQAFPFFKPTCLCREPHVDPECNSFRDFLFDHPCVYVLKKDPLPVEPLPTCNHALSVCQRGKTCVKLFDDFKTNCKARDGKCRMESRETCHDAWTHLRLSPMFGCICPNNHMKRRCDKIFSIVNHNPCVEFLPSATIDLSGTDSALYPFDPHQENFQEFWFPPTSMYPYFLFPATATTRTFNEIEARYRYHEVPPPKAPEVPKQRHGNLGHHAPVKVISHPDNSTSFELIESQLENPLIDADHRDLHALKQIPIPDVPRRKIHHGKNHSKSEQNSKGGKPAVALFSGSKAKGHRVVHRPAAAVTLSSTCHQAYTSCSNDPDCKTALQPVLNHCDLGNCARNACMDALQQFYRTASEAHTMEIAFCLCRKTNNKRDDCIIAQEKMHPACAQRVEGVEMPTCHSLAEVCREDKACRKRLEYYEQSCAVDSVTKKCAGVTKECRRAMIGILGTELRSNCACKGTDLAQVSDCLGWQRLLWVNPCVVESQKDFHARRKAHRQRTTTVLTLTTEVEENSSDLAESHSVEPISKVTQVADSWDSTTTVSTTSTTTTTTTTTTTVPPRFCIVQRPRQTHQYIREGRGKRLYREDEPECSELCQCSEGEVLICNTICVESSPCKTDFAFYNHAAPAYQAYRGRCLCYSGRFICMRPFPDAYSIPHGIFMFLGYSEADENLLKQHSNLTILDAVSSLDSFVRQEIDNQTVCTLLLYNVTKENVIAIAQIKSDTTLTGNTSHQSRSQAELQTQVQTLQQLKRVKDECAEMLRDLSEKINNKHHEVYTHPLLSIFKMAEVEVRLPQTNRGSPSRFVKDPLQRLLLTLLLVTTSYLVTRRPGICIPTVTPSAFVKTMRQGS
ncbi:uncharacterized protein LOC124182566 isoform X2 [Neodiprion fabricii]|uniref:uncharacterized protein LOC124182566 isoform X2 n=1 Tax=Neodiprion fabricii TaxID=2872261 RepID=UPI001ED8CA41|nr:uncharacterized protein LOC124182566 isoform X2 [Neodiprion fabricii]